MRKINILLLAIFLFQNCEKAEFEDKHITTYENVNVKQIKLDTEMDITHLVFVNEKVGFLGGNVIDTLTVAGSPIQMDTISNYSGEMPGVIFFDVNYESHAKFDAPLYKTNDGGQSWEPISFFKNKSSILDIKFINEQNGLVITEAHGGYMTKNGGNTWEKVICDQFYVVEKPGSIGKMGGIEQISIQDENTWHLYSPTGSSVIKTEDAGKTWKLKAYSNYEFDGNMPNYIGYLHFDSNNPKIGYAYNNSNSILYKTIDGGKLWKEINNIPKPHLLQALEDGTIYLTTKKEIYRSIDKGASWKNITFDVPNVNEEYQDYSYYSENWFDYDGLVKAFHVTPTSNMYCFFAYEKVYRLDSNDGSFTKLVEIIPKEGFLRKIYFYSDGLGFIYGDNGLLYRCSFM